jgi:hypothetical protein
MFKRGSMIEKIEHGNKVFAIILRKKSDMEKTEFLTPEDYPLQLGILKYGNGAVVKPHIHKTFEKVINKRQEVLLIQKGKIEASFYTNGGKKIASTVLNQGDVLFLADGGHGFKMLEDAKIIEVKQGPYDGVERDKEMLSE